jgi:hypothetical protein
LTRGKKYCYKVSYSKSKTIGVNKASGISMDTSSCLLSWLSLAMLIRIERFNDLLSSIGEDKSRIRINAGIFSTLRSFALNILRKNKVANVSVALYDNSLNLDNVLNYDGIF